MAEIIRDESMTRVFSAGYPKQIMLFNGELVTVRPMEETDEKALLDFFRRIPEEDRYYLKDDVTSVDVISHWAKNINFFRTYPLLAIIDGKVVADATLHQKRPGGRRHIGEIRISVDPEYRNQGLGTKIVRELIEVAYLRRLEIVTIELVEGMEAKAIGMVERLGFHRSAVLPNHVKDQQGKSQNLVILELSVDRWYKDWYDF
ncbi:MAG: putative GCN5-related N-acetyltransferase [Dehalococcoidia bacterium]|nr:putative GCN5-related N-acetyltransferase [Dehalococcoidia bacterium]